MTEVQTRLAYGAHPRQVMDLYAPATPSATTPVLVFLHGGGFRRGDPATQGYQGEAALERGARFVALGYRLVPDVRFPDCVADVEQGLLALREQFGPEAPIYLAGHSAGAMLAAWLALRASPVDLLRGIVLISGFYDLTQQSDEIVNRASPRYVPRLAEALERAPAHTLLVVGEHDFPRALPDARALESALVARGASVETFIEPGADHYQANRGFTWSNGHVFQAVARMMGL